MNLKTNTILFWVVVVSVFAGILYIYNGRHEMEHFAAGIDYEMNTGYCGVTKKPDGHEWRKYPSNTPLLDSTTTIMGHGFPKGEFKDNKLEDGQRQMFLFAKNKCSPDCCPSSYMCTGGCVCTTEEQRKLINQRG